MKFFIDTANIDQIREVNDLGLLDGVTTNPTLVAKEKKGFRETIEEICAVVKGPVNAEVAEMRRNADEGSECGRTKYRALDRVCSRGVRCSRTRRRRPPSGQRASRGVILRAALRKHCVSNDSP